VTTFAQPFQDYEILDRVGAGAMGTVFKARHKRLNRIVALKVLKPSLARDKRYVDRLRREARIVASLSHPHIVTGYDLGEEGGYHFFVMEFVEGKSLRALLVERGAVGRGGVFDEAFVRHVARQVAMALDHAYQRGVIHRDIKPGNILIDEAGAVKLTDMGLAKGPADLTLTRDGATVGTPHYISPEQARNPQDVDVRTDLYSLGATLYHMATGSPPFVGETVAELITSLLHAPLEPPEELNPQLSPGMALVIRKLLARNLPVRYQTPRELLDDLDRIERAQMPAVDERRLAEAARVPSRWLRRASLALVVLLVTWLAWWGGRNASRATVDEPSAAEFLQELEGALAALPTPGARLQHLSTITTAPVGSALLLAQRRREVVVALQRTVDGVVGELLGAGWSGLVLWLRSPDVWPDRQQVERERLQPALLAQAGVVLGQLPTNVRLHRLDELLHAIDREIVDRDAELVARFELFVGTAVPARADERIRAGDFAGAERLFRDAVPTFLDGVRQPLPEKVVDAARRTILERHLLAQQAFRVGLDAVESGTAAAMLQEADEAIAALRERLQAGTDAAVVATVLSDLRQRLAHVWPPAARYRPEHNPWPAVERGLAVLAQEVDVAGAVARAAVFERRLDLAWRSLCRGTAADAMLVLADAGDAPPEVQPLLQHHRAALGAAESVETAVYAAIQRAERPPVAFPLLAVAEPFELRVEAGVLFGQAVGQPRRRARLTEFRLGDLLDRLRSGGDDPLVDMPAPQRDLGVALLRLVADDVAGVRRYVEPLARDERQFVVDDVWPRILRVREERTEVRVDRAQLFAGIERAIVDAERLGSLTELEKILLACEVQVPASERTPTEQKLMRRGRAWLELARRRRAVADELAREAPRGARTGTWVEDQQIVAEVELDAAALQRDAGEGWHLRDDLVEFVGGGRPWSELALVALASKPGLDAQSPRLRLQCDLAVPASTAGRRLYLVEFRGIACALAITADDRVHAALVDGPALRESAAQSAFDRALSGVLAPSRAVALPGAVHRLTFEVHTSTSRTRAQVVVTFEGVEILRELRPIEPARAPAVTLWPLQEVAVRRVVVRAEGL
jgi:tRNA A-37 threonylcarbamoyl transferase component Bud32